MACSPPSLPVSLHDLVANCPASPQLRLMCQFSNSVTVEVMPPYIPSAAEKADPALYAANIRKLIVSSKAWQAGIVRQ